MKNFFLLILSIILIFSSCKKTEKQILSGGKIVYNAENYILKKARCANSGDENSVGLNTMNLFFASSSIKMDEDGISGTGIVLALTTFSLSDTLQEGVYNIENFVSEKNILSDSSYFKIITKEDTLTVKISGGYMEIKNDLELKKRFEFHFISENGDSVTGYFAGAVPYNLMFDQPAVAQIMVDAVEYQIQKGDFVRWGKLLTDTLFYYEIYFYSTNLRRTDAGKIKNGFMLILGMHSLTDNYPTNGTYRVSRNFENNTLLWGTKIGNGRWGTYWNLYRNGSSTATSNIFTGEIEFEKSENNFKIRLNLKDQNNNIISGEYDNELNVKEL